MSRWPESEERDRRFYEAQDASECNLCRPWAKSSPGSDECILAISDDEEFRQRLTANRTYADGLILLRERARRRREGAA